MAILKDDGKISGHIGGHIFQPVAGMQVVRAMPGQYHDRKSPEQLKQRSGMNNIIATYRLLKKAMLGCFESDYNAYGPFRHHNLLQEPVELSRDMYSRGASLIAPYIVADGSLSSLSVTVDGEGIASCQLKKAEWKNGDTLRCIIMQQTEHSQLHIPVAKVTVTDRIVNTPKDEVITSEPLHNAAIAWIHLRETKKKHLSSRQRLVMIP